MKERFKKAADVSLFVFKELKDRFLSHNIGYAGGTLAYFFILSIFPFLIFINSIIASLDIPSSSAISFLRPFLPEQIVSLIATYIEYISQNSSIPILSFGIILAIFSASRSVRSLIYAFDLAYGVKNRRSILRNTLFSMLYLFIFAIMLVVCIAIVAFGSSFVEGLIAKLTLPFNIIDLFSFWQWITMSAILFLILSAVYKFLPSVKVRFRDTIPGTLFSLIGFLILTAAFSFYVNNLISSLSLYGSLSTVILLMLWFYFAGIIIMLGAELNKVISDIKKVR